MVDQDGPSSSGMPSPTRGSVDNIYPQPSHYSQDGPNLSRTLPVNCLLSVYGAGVQVQGAGCVGGGVCRCREQGVHGEGVQGVYGEGVQAGCVRGRAFAGAGAGPGCVRSRACRCRGAASALSAVAGGSVVGEQARLAQGPTYASVAAGRGCAKARPRGGAAPVNTEQRPKFIPMTRSIRAAMGGGSRELPTRQTSLVPFLSPRPPMAGGLAPATTGAAGRPPGPAKQCIPQGVRNYGNNCWVNASVQCISAALSCAPPESKDQIFQLLRRLKNGAGAPSEIEKLHELWLE
eukprot:g1629.t1